MAISPITLASPGDIFWTAQQLGWPSPGGLAIAAVFGCAGFAACTGSSTA